MQILFIKEIPDSLRFLKGRVEIVQIGSQYLIRRYYSFFQTNEFLVRNNHSKEVGFFSDNPTLPKVSFKHFFLAYECIENQFCKSNQNRKFH